MSKKSKKKKKAKKKLQKNTQAAKTVKTEKQPVLEQKAEPEKVNETKEPKTKKITKIKTALREKKAQIKGKIKDTNDFLFVSSGKIWKIGLIFGTALLSLFIQYYVFNVFDPEAIKTNAAQVKTSAQEAYKISDDFDLIDTEKTNPGYYLATGETDKDIYSFGVKSTGDSPLVLEDITLTATGQIPEGFLLNIRLFEGENAISKAELKNNKLVFKKITSILQPGAEKKYVVKTDVSKDGESGIRFKLSLVNPTDITISKDKEAIYSLDTFPFEGAYTTVVGWRKK